MLSIDSSSSCSTCDPAHCLPIFLKFAPVATPQVPISITESTSPGNPYLSPVTTYGQGMLLSRIGRLLLKTSQETRCKKFMEMLIMKILYINIKRHFHKNRLIFNSIFHILFEEPLQDMLQTFQGFVFFVTYTQFCHSSMKAATDIHKINRYGYVPIKFYFMGTGFESQVILACHHILLLIQFVDVKSF